MLRSTLGNAVVAVGLVGFDQNLFCCLGLTLSLHFTHDLAIDCGRTTGKCYFVFESNATTAGTHNFILQAMGPGLCLRTQAAYVWEAVLIFNRELSRSVIRD
jgi:hypothetical protein